MKISLEHMKVACYNEYLLCYNPNAKKCLFFSFYPNPPLLQRLSQSSLDHIIWADPTASVLSGLLGYQQAQILCNRSNRDHSRNHLLPIICSIIFKYLAIHHQRCHC
jgi:hypothetical protein